jgi:hypothetical protein
MQIRIKGYSFQLSEPYAEGHSLTRQEAQAMNALRVENISNNVRKLVAQAVAGLPDGDLLAPAVLLEIQEEITRYDSQYSFGERVAAPPRRGDLEIAAREIARELVLAGAREQGLELSEDEAEVLVAQMAQTPKVLEAAHAAATAKRRALADELEELISD